jgi:hypothetical protein
MRALVFLLALDFVRPVGHTVVLCFAMRVPGRYGGISIVVGGGCGVFARDHPRVLGLPVLDHPWAVIVCLVADLARGILARGILARGILARGILGLGIPGLGVLARGILARGIPGLGVLARGIPALGLLLGLGIPARLGVWCPTPLLAGYK